jgi:hypothetical protein
MRRPLRIDDDCVKSPRSGKLAEGALETESEIRGGPLEKAWQACADLYCEKVKALVSIANGDVEDEILFCLLGGFGVTFEHSRSAAKIVADLEPFSESWDDDQLFETIVWTLSRPRFDPPRRDGTLRRYRFPQRKALLIVNARGWLRQHAPLDKRLEALSSAKDRRAFLCSCPGIGPKTASWLLRNLGWAEDLAILDVHVVRALSEARRIGRDVRLPRDYDAIEDAFLEWCRELGAPVPAFDLFVWEWQRSLLAR